MLKRFPLLLGWFVTLVFPLALFANTHLSKKPTSKKAQNAKSQKSPSQKKARIFRAFRNYYFINKPMPEAYEFAIYFDSMGARIQVMRVTQSGKVIPTFSGWGRDAVPPKTAKPLPASVKKSFGLAEKTLKRRYSKVKIKKVVYRGFFRTFRLDEVIPLDHKNKNILFATATFRVYTGKPNLPMKPNVYTGIRSFQFMQRIISNTSPVVNYIPPQKLRGTLVLLGATKKSATQLYQSAFKKLHRSAVFTFMSAIKNKYKDAWGSVSQQHGNSILPKGFQHTIMLKAYTTIQPKDKKKGRQTVLRTPLFFRTNDVFQKIARSATLTLHNGKYSMWGELSVKKRLIQPKNKKGTPQKKKAPKISKKDYFLTLKVHLQRKKDKKTKHFVVQHRVPKEMVIQENKSFVLAFAMVSSMQTFFIPFYNPGLSREMAVTLTKPKLNSVQIGKVGVHLEEVPVYPRFLRK